MPDTSGVIISLNIIIFLDVCKWCLYAIYIPWVLLRNANLIKIAKNDPNN